MKIEISSKEYRDLLDVLHIADVVMTGHRREEDKRTERHRALVQKLYALAQGEGLDQLIRHDANLNKHVPTPEYERETLAHVLLDEFGSHLFWDELINRLTERDTALMAGGMEAFNALGESERRQMEAPIRQRYVQEFTTNGVARLEIIERFGTGGSGQVKTSD